MANSMARRTEKIMYINASAPAIMVIMLAVAGSTSLTRAQECASKLLGCADYLNATAPPPSKCCGSLKTAVTEELPCLCSLLGNTALLKTYSVNVTQAFHLAKLCGANADLGTACTAPSTSSGAGTPTSNGNNSHGLTRIKMSGLFTLVLCSSSLLA